MNKLKSLFIGPYMMSTVALAAFAVWRIAHEGASLAWSGVLLTTVPLLATITWIMASRNVARTSNHLPTVGALGVIGIAIAAWSWIAAGGTFPPVVLATASFVGFALYSYWYSHLDRSKPSNLRIGRRLPSFTVRDLDGTVLQSETITERPTIILFYRGNWCPLCMAQIKELSARTRDFAALGTRIALISPQPLAHTASLAKQHDLGLDFYVDEGNAAARSLGIADPDGLPMGMQALGYASETVLPTLIFTDWKGHVAWTHETDNYRVRPDPDTYLEVLRRHRVVPAAA